MFGRKTRLLATMLAMLPALAGAALAQDTPKDETRTNGYNAIIDNLDLLIDNYSRFMARKYNLTEDQDAYTKQLIRERAYAFLEKNENDLRGLFDEMFQARSGADMSQDGLLSWAKRAQPLYEQAKKLVEDGNNQWREILNDDQKKIHDQDLKTMQESFATTEEQLGRMLSGEMTVEEFRNPRAGQKARKEAQRRRQEQMIADRGAVTVERPAQTGVPGLSKGEPPPPPQDPEAQQQHVEAAGMEPPPPDAKAQASDGGEPLPEPPPDHGKIEAAPEQPVEHVAEQPAQPDAQPQPGHQPDPGHAQPATPDQPDKNKPKDARSTRNLTAGGKNFETEWEKYTKDFIDRFGLNEDQTQRANTILKDCQDSAAKILGGKKAELDEIEKKEAELKAAPSDATKQKQLGELAKRRDSLLEPINAIFEKQLKPRLDKLPTRAQRKAAEDAAKKPAPAKDKKPTDKDKPAGKDKGKP